MKRKIGLAALTVMELAPHEQVSVAAQAGYDCVGLRLVPVQGQPVVHEVDEKELERRLADTGLRVLDVEVFRLAPDTRVFSYEKTLAIAARLGATDLLVHGADADAARLADNLCALCDLAGGYGLGVNIEPMPWVEVSTAAKANRLLARANRRNAALLVDAIHFFREDNSFRDLKDASCRYVQICDAPADRPADVEEIIRQARTDRLMPGEGGLYLRGLLAALPRDLPVSVEIPYAKPMAPLERAKLALEKTRQLLT